MPEQRKRRAGREKALAVLYALHFSLVHDQAETEKRFMLCPEGKEGTVAVRTGPPEGFAWELVQGVSAFQEELDEIIKRFSQNWKLERISPIDLAILRIALLEMLFKDEIPVNVAINEAVELAKRFSEPNAPAFINGILDSAARQKESLSKTEKDNSDGKILPR